MNTNFAIFSTRSTKNTFWRIIIIQAIDQIKKNRKRYNNIDGIENKLTRFQNYPETELACKFKSPLYKEQYS